MPYKEGKFIIDGNERFEIEGIAQVTLVETVPSGTAPMTKRTNAAFTLTQLAKNQVIFMKRVTIYPCVEMTTEDLWLAVQIIYDVNDALIFPEVTSVPAYEGLQASKAVAHSVDLSEFPIRIDSRKALQLNWINADAADRTLRMAFEFYRAQLKREVAR